ncbi:hypothetical protein CC85DRAFT_327604 [Cutaneotrichosporon oleaginosum]|uniref:CUE domain-containing protein n=1 Tax=Cutaneotrichosporon oleaginosum TaxID=879819 RepID=A0A0J0XPQ4_9TREE|nr:uncharacterized protein CC85DRAFT_327604 [Cutaneotrichosporon oleaginosum]KLT43083.1 hypothetical protein CC85DRAFT_327604 [Cutaneotrichosporon oleaginosum]TXT10013.1 hypothetical protein COLE_03947 [Cutaneotrichosporon oleaginosum]
MLPADPPPASLAASALPHLATAVTQAVPSGPRALLPPLALALRTLARARLSDNPPPVPLAPLHAFTSLAAEDPAAIPLQTLTDALLAYPSEVGALSPALSSLLKEREAELAAMIASAPSAITSLPSSSHSPTDPSLPLLTTARLLHALLRLPAAHIVLAHAPDLVPALVTAYQSANIRAKAETLTLLRVLLENSERLRALLPPARTGTPLVDQNVTADLALFSTQKPGEAAEALRALHDDERRDDPRLQPLLNLFPSLPAHLLADSLAHPAFSARAGATASEQAAPLVDAILARTLPPDLHELRAVAASLNAAAGPSSPTKQAARRGGWDDVDLSKLRLKGDSEAPAEIPDALRASILRLVEAQEEEAEAAARAVAEAHGDGSDEEDDVAPARGPVADGEDSSEGSDGEADAQGEDGQRTPARKENVQVVLEIAYIQTPAVFSRDSATRRSAARADLRERTGMDDSQIEGWKIMLERNPHKDAILERHQYLRPSNDATPKRDGGGGGGGGESSRGGRGGGSGSGGRGGRGGGGRGRGNKGSRGHSNAARTRGHDKKMSRMGAGL